MNKADDFILDLVVPIHGNLPLNKFFFESLVENTRNRFRLFVIDNHSPDNSPDYFRQQKGERFEVIVFSNDRNRCYPVSMNQGISATTSPVVGLLNNDIVFGPAWDLPLVSFILKEQGDIVSPIGLEHLPDREMEEFLFYRWRRILKKEFSRDLEQNLRMKIGSMYGDFEQFALWIQNRFSGVAFPGIMGHCHLVSRSFLEMTKGLDPRLQAADWDLYLTAANLVESGKIRTLPQILGDSFVHHFIRATARTKNREPFVCEHPPHIAPEEKWGVQAISRFWPFVEQRPGYKKPFGAKMRKLESKWKAFSSLSNENLIQILSG